ncbi:hypothetical protein LAZ67_X000477 [Cordylochernes scorpioides]|uniref:RNA-directed DNA polymerase n=1 Tax=Cordylochernes scorpioides TaxID=51811 RepID=A0ABY6LS08_9ARAC|nr:hypothetical protein LAZ67_X000477 [Cordylochernes scorpioides]
MIYRTHLMRKYLTAYDAGTALTINLKQAVDIISVAWNDVLPATISNCWHHSGIIKSDVSSPLDTPQPATQILEQQSLFDRMKEVLKIPLEMDFDSYADADNDVVTNAMLSDVEIVESILQAKEEEETDHVDEEVDPIVHIPHPKEVLESIQTLRLFLQCQDESKSLHRHLSDLDNIEKSVQHLDQEVEGDRTLVIPKGMEMEIIKLAHEEEHFDVQKNFEMLKKEYFITDLKSKIKKYIQNCIPCILSNKKYGKQEGMLHPISKGDTPLDTYHIDHFGPLFTWIYPTKTTRTSEVIQKLECQQQIFGNPRRIITNQGTAFTSNDIKEYCKEESIEH